MMTQLGSMDLRGVLAMAVPLLALGVILLWATLLRRRGRFEGLPGRLHGLGEHFQSARARELARDVAALGSSTVVSLFAVLFAAAFLLAGDALAALLLPLAAAVAGALGTLLKRLTRRLRPGLAAAEHFGSSFPSSHTLMGSTLYGTAAMLLIAVGGLSPLAGLAGTVAVLLALLIGASRVVLRVHYVSDVVAGWLLAAALITSANLLHSLASA